MLTNSAPPGCSLVDRRLPTFLAILRALVRIGLVLAGACLLMTVIQVVGVG